MYSESIARLGAQLKEICPLFAKDKWGEYETNQNRIDGEEDIPDWYF